MVSLPLAGAEALAADTPSSCARGWPQVRSQDDASGRPPVDTTGSSASRSPYHTGKEDRMAHDDQRRHEIVAALRGVALFRGLPDAELAGLAARMVRKRYERDEVIFWHGEP